MDTRINYYENRMTGDIMAVTKENFDALCLNPNQWDKISKERYDKLKELTNGK